MLDREVNTSYSPLKLLSQESDSTANMSLYQDRIERRALTALANKLYSMLGLTAGLTGMYFQANSIKQRRMLSFNYLGM